MPYINNNTFKNNAATTGASSQDLLQDIIDRSCNEMYFEFKSYLENKPNASGTELGEELGSLRNKYSAQLFADREREGISWDQFNAEDPCGQINQYADQIQHIISYYSPEAPGGHTNLADIPAPAGAADPETKIQNDLNAAEQVGRTITAQIEQDQRAIAALNHQIVAWQEQIADLEQNPGAEQEPAKTDLATARALLAALQDKSSALESELSILQGLQQQEADQAAQFSDLLAYPTSDNVERADALLADVKMLGSNVQAAQQDFIEKKPSSSDLSAIRTAILKIQTDLNLVPPPSPPDVQKYKDLEDALWGQLDQIESKYAGTAVDGLLVDDYTNTVHSEGVGYGMLAAIGDNDKAKFLQYLHFMAERLDNFGLMNWNVNTEGTIVSAYNGHYAATDGDQDIVEAMIQGLKKWPELATEPVTAIKIGFDNAHGREMAPETLPITNYMDLLKFQMNAIWTMEVGHGGVNTNVILPGDGWGPRPYSQSVTNVSYFRPSYMKDFQDFYDTTMKTDPQYAAQNWFGDDSSVYNTMYEATLKAMESNKQGLPPGWSDIATGAPGGMAKDFQYDAVRVLQFIAMDYKNNPQNETARKILSSILGYYASPSASFPANIDPIGPSDPKLPYAGVLPQAGWQCTQDPTLAACLLVAAAVMGPDYQPMVDGCIARLTSPAGLANLRYFSGSLAVMAAQFLGGYFPS
jgi:endo-1,4-beta-D-glucanase Y